MELQKEQILKKEKLKELETEFEKWRKTKIGKESIPERLWDAASELVVTKQYKLSEVCKRLRLSHSTLKMKAEQKGLNKPDEGVEIANPSFVEFSMEQFRGQITGKQPYYKIEMESKAGMILKIEATDIGNMDLTELCNSFIRNRI